MTVITIQGGSGKGSLAQQVGPLNAPNVGHSSLGISASTEKYHPFDKVKDGTENLLTGRAHVTEFILSEGLSEKLKRDTKFWMRVLEIRLGEKRWKQAKQAFCKQITVRPLNQAVVALRLLRSRLHVNQMDFDLHQSFHPSKASLTRKGFKPFPLFFL